MRSKNGRHCFSYLTTVLQAHFRRVPNVTIWVHLEVLQRCALKSAVIVSVICQQFFRRIFVGYLMSLFGHIWRCYSGALFNLPSLFQLFDNSSLGALS